jgi:acetyl-CoA carboxylase carboxyl transferase subunit alpha
MPQTEDTARPAGADLTPWDRVQLARRPDRPHTLDYIRAIFTDFVELHGDRRYADDTALVAGLAKLDSRSVLVMGHQKGSDTRENVARNFGMPRPEGYRKAIRLMEHAEKFGLPLISFIDTPAADPGLESEQRGQAQAIAESLQTMAGLKVPSIALVIGEGGSGGALAIGLADRILMLENAVYAVASPEACAAILWRDASQAPKAAEALKITALDLAGFGIVDEIIPEPAGGAHLDTPATVATVQAALVRHLKELEQSVGLPAKEGVAKLLELRYQKFRQIGRWQVSQSLTPPGDTEPA